MVFERLRATLELDTSGFRSGIKEAQNDMDGLSSRMQSTGKSMQRAGAGLTAGVTAPLVGMGAMATKQAANFDQAMQKSIAVMGDVSDAQREDLEKTARDVAKSMSVSHEEAASSFYYLASAGLDAQESMAAMPKVAAFAEAGQMDMAEATDVATNVMSAFGYEAEEMTEVTDTMTATVTNHNQTMEGMSSAMSQVAPIASSLGVSIGETATSIGMMGDVGIQAEKAGTALRNVLSQLSDESSTASSKLAEMGVQVRDSEGNLLSFHEILTNMEEAGIEASDAASVFGKEAGPAMAALLDQGGDALKENTEQIESMEGATEDVAETQRDTLNAELGILKSNLADVGITIGNILIPMLNTLVQALMPIGEWFQNLSGTQQKFIVAILGLVAALGPLLLIFGTLLTMLPAMSAGFAILTAATLPVSGPILAIGAAIGILAAIVATDFMGIRTMMVNAIKIILGALVGFVKFLVTDVPQAVGVMASRVVAGAKDAYQRFTSWITNLITDALSTINGYWSRFKSAGRGLIDGFISGIKEKAGEVADAVKGGMQTVAKFLTGSDAEQGPLDNVTGQGAGLPEAYASGIRSNTGVLEPAAEQVAENAKPRVNPDAPGSSQGRSQEGAAVSIDFGNLDDDDYVSVGALKQMIFDDLDRQAKLEQKRTPGA